MTLNDFYITVDGTKQLSASFMLTYLFFSPSNILNFSYIWKQAIRSKKFVKFKKLCERLQKLSRHEIVWNWILTLLLSSDLELKRFSGVLRLGIINIQQDDCEARLAILLGYFWTNIEVLFASHIESY